MKTKQKTMFAAVCAAKQTLRIIQSLMFSLRKVNNRLLSVLFAGASLFAWSAEVSTEQAKVAAKQWILRHPQVMTADFSAAKKDLDAHSTYSHDGIPLFHIVPLDGGGFVVTSGDTRLPPIIAFSDIGELDVDDSNNPLFVMLEQDMSHRIEGLQHLSVTNFQNATAGSVSENEKEWEKLLHDEFLSPNAAYGAYNSLKDVRVSPLVKSAWNQSKWNGENTFNLKTPNHYVSGCVATAYAQIMRFWEYPKETIGKKTYTCYVGGHLTTRQAVQKTTEGGVYDWDNMPLTADKCTTAAQRNTIGKLLYDVGIASMMNWDTTENNGPGSGTWGFITARSLKEYFGYSSAVTYFPNAEEYALSDNISKTKNYRNAMLSSLDAGMPVAIGMTSAKGGHEVVVDGYGYNGNSLVYCHINCGWSNSSWNTWYNMFGESITDCSFYRLNEMAYNIHPTIAGDVISGRITDTKDNAVSGATVTLVKPDGNTIKTSSNANGIYSFRVSSSGQYSVYAQYSSNVSSKKSVNLVISQDSHLYCYDNNGARTFGVENGSLNAYEFGTMGNSWGNDLVIPNSSISVSPEMQSHAYSTSEGSFSVTASSSWAVSKSHSWITLKTTSGSGKGTVYYEVEENKTGEQREGTITVQCGSETATHTVRQSAEAAKLILKPTTSDVSCALDGGSFDVEANYSWTATTTASWITVNTPSGSGNGTVLYSVLENTGSQRTGTITVTSGSLTATHTVTQAAKPQLSIDPSVNNCTAAASQGSFRVTSDSMWTVTTSATWIKLNTVSGSGNGNVTYAVDENTGDSRQGLIYVRCGTVKSSHMVAQTRKEEISFSEEAATVSDAGGSGTFTVTIKATSYYVSVELPDPKNWARWNWTSEKLALSEGIRYTITYTVDKNPSYGEKRTIKIPITFNGTTYYFTITQGFGADTYRVSYEPGANGRGFAFYNIKTHDVPISLSASTFTRSGYTQKGWATIDGGAKVYDFGASYTKNEAITLYPYWEKDTGSVATTYSVCFYPGSYGSGDIQWATKYKGVALTLPGAIYTREGYEQTGWSTLRSGTTKAYDLGCAYTTDAGAFLYPYWTEKAPEQCDVGFYTPSAYKQPMCLSATNIAYWAYAPQYVFEQGGGLVLNYCAANYSDADATLVDKHMSLWDVAGNRIEAEMESYADTIPAGKGMLFPNRNYSSWLSSLAPGNYALRVYLDPYDKLNDPDDSNNEWQTWFSVKADGISYKEALDCSSLSFTNDGSPAFTQTSECVVGGSCVQFGPQPTNSSSSIMWSYITEAGELSFKWKAVSRDCKGCMVFFVGSEMKKWKWGTDEEWGDVTISISEEDVSSGGIWLRWQLYTYDADPLVLTAGWLDNVVWNPSGRKPTFTVDANGKITKIELNGVTDLEIPSMVNSTAVRSIGYCALTNSALTSVSIPETVTNIERFAFYNNQSLSGVTIPGSVRSIGESAFNACGSLKSVVLNEGVTTIEGYAFYNCGSLSTVSIPASVKDLGPSPFGMCGNLTTISVAPGNWYYIVENNALIDISSRTLIQYPSGRTESEYEVPEGLFAIGYDAFDNVARLERVVVPASVTALEGYAFWKCQNLQTIVFKGDAPSVGQYALSGLDSSCKALVSPQSSGWGVNIPGTWRGIGIEYSAALQTYAVTYKPGSYGTGSQTSEVKQYGITLPLKGAIFTRTGYLQTGWATSDGGAKVYELGASYTDNAAVTLYPYWEASTYGVAYELDGGSSGVSVPTSATYGTSFRVSAPVRDGYVFMGWMVTSGLDITTARYGESESNQSTEISNSSQQCFNGSDVDVWFVNLTPVAEGNVTLTATWESVPDDSRDIGFYAPSGKEWAFPICLSSTNIEYLAYAPETEFVQFSDVRLSFCVVNWSTAGTALLQSTLLTVADEHGNIFDQGEPIQLKSIGAYGYGEVRNLSLRRYMRGISPGRYKLTLELDPNRLLADPDRSNNTTSIWFTVSAPSDPVPELPSDATAADVRAALAGSADSRLAENVGDVSTYSAYREWARAAKGADGNPVGVEAVKASDKAWFSFAVDSPTLVAKDLSDGDVAIEDFGLAADGGRFDFVVGIDDVEIGEGATMARLKTIFGIEGATRVDNSAFSSDNLILEAAEPEHGKVKLTAKPAAPKTGEDSAISAFFMRVKVQ